VLIAGACIPLAETLDEVIVNHPILGGFPPAISAAAGQKSNSLTQQTNTKSTIIIIITAIFICSFSFILWYTPHTTHHTPHTQLLNVIIDLLFPL
jgi:hypothetical protein